MSILPRIIGRIAFVRAEFAPDGSCRTDIFLWHRNGIVPAARSEAKHALAALVVCGHGVVTKTDDAQIAERVRSDADTFLWSTVGGKTSFVRRERLGMLLEELAAQGIVAVRLFCADTAAKPEAWAPLFAERIREGLSCRTLVRPSVESSVAAQTLVRRAAPAVLGLLLCLLCANAVLSTRLSTRRDTLQRMLAAREQTASDAALSGMRQKELFALFAARPRTPRAVVCDRIAGAMPEEVVLTALDIEPLAKRFEAGKPLVRRENRAEVSGTAPAAADVSAFVRRLSEVECCRDVRLTGVTKERDGGGLMFRIEIVL